jgi:hypothetical protein
MEIGIGQWQSAHEWYYRDLGLSWVKLGLDVSNPPQDYFQGYLDRIRELDMRVVVDLRTSPEWIQTEGRKYAAELSAAGKLEDPVNEAAIFRNECRAHLALQDQYAEWCANMAQRLAPWVADFEIWGESACPYVTGGAFGQDSRVYSAYLEAAYGAIKTVRPEARVWTGGNGMSNHGLDPNYFYAILDDGRGDAFNVANWHPYHVEIDPTDDAREYLQRCREQYAALRGDLKLRGNNQPYAASEWGFPSSGYAPEGFERFLRSMVVEGVVELTAGEALEWMEEDLRVMQDAGFQVVCLDKIVDHAGEDNKARFWGDKIGLVTANLEAKPVYTLIQEWAWAGREQPAFAEPVAEGAAQWS